MIIQILSGLIDLNSSIILEYGFFILLILIFWVTIPLLHNLRIKRREIVLGEIEWMEPKENDPDIMIICTKFMYKDILYEITEEFEEDKNFKEGDFVRVYVNKSNPFKSTIRGIYGIWKFMIVLIFLLYYFYLMSREI